MYWGAANPAPLYDWSGDRLENRGARPGDNLYTTSVIALDIDTGKLKFYHQELPHDTWDFDSAIGEFVEIDRDGKQYMVHPNKSGFIFVYDRDLKVQNVWPLINASNFVKAIDPKTGELIGRRDFTAGKAAEPLCPAIAGGVSWNSGSYSPKTGLYYKSRQRVVHRARCGEDDAGDRAGAAQHRRELPRWFRRRAARSTAISTRAIRSPAPRSGRCAFPQPPLASVLSTAGNLVFRAGRARHHCTPTTRKPAGSCGTTPMASAMQGGIISYSAGGKQYIAVTAGFGSLVGDGYGAMFGEPYKSMPRDEGLLVVYSLK